MARLILGSVHTQETMFYLKQNDRAAGAHMEADRKNIGIKQMSKAPHTCQKRNGERDKMEVV